MVREYWKFIRISSGLIKLSRFKEDTRKMSPKRKLYLSKLRKTPHQYDAWQSTPSSMSMTKDPDAGGCTKK